MPNPAILICDDDRAVHDTLELLLGTTYPLVLCDRPETCMELMEKTPNIKLVFMDIKMPKVSGLDLLKEIKEKYPDVHVVMVTAYLSVEAAQECVRQGASGYQIKPFKSEDILAAAKKFTA